MFFSFSNEKYSSSTVLGVSQKLNKKEFLYQWLSLRFGINKLTALTICSKLGFGKSVLKVDLTDVELYEVQQFIESNYKLDSFLKKEIYISIDRLVKLKTYRGLRHRESLPVRGQSSRNGRTQKRFKNRLKV